MPVAFDARFPDSDGELGSFIIGGSPDSITWNHTCTGLKGLLIVSVSVGVLTDAGVSITSVTHDGVSMTSILKRESNDGDDGFLEIFKLVAPATGSKPIVVNLSWSGVDTALTVIGGSVSFTGVDQDNPIAHTNSAAGNSAAPSVSITSSVDNMTMDGMVIGGSINPPTANSPSTQQWSRKENGSSAGGNSGAATQPGTASNTHAWTSDVVDWWATIALDIAADIPIDVPPIPSQIVVYHPEPEEV